jgi:uncharacterized phage protein
MIEMILRLFEAKPVSIETAVGRSTGSIGRDEFIAAAREGCRSHPIGWHLILAEEMADKASVAILMEYLTRACGTQEIGQAAMSIIMGRPLPQQLDCLITKSAYYDAERRRASIVMERAKRAHRAGDQDRYIAIKAERDGILSSARTRVADEILQSGRCPKCKGTGIRERKQDQCPVCFGAGKVVPDISLIGRQFGAETQEVVRKIVDAVQIDKSRCLDVIGRRAQMEREAA